MSRKWVIIGVLTGAWAFGLVTGFVYVIMQLDPEELEAHADREMWG